MLRAALLASLGLLLAAPPSSSRTWHITPDGTGDAPTIQAGIDSAAVGDVVELACGTYHEFGVELRSHVMLRSASERPDCAIIDGMGLGNVLRAIGDTTSVSGVTIQGGHSAYGGGIYSDRSDLRITRCTFDGNEALYYGGGVHGYRSSLLVQSCLFVRNAQTRNSTPMVGGGALAFYYSSVSVVNCTLVNNLAANRGGAFFGDRNTTISLVRSIVAFHPGPPPFAAPGSAWGIYFPSCCDIYGNEATDGQLDGIDPSTFHADPLFCDIETDDFNLQWGSPCLPANSGDCGLVGQFGFGGCNSVSVEDMTWGKIKAMYR